jgi:glutamine synthetase
VKLGMGEEEDSLEAWFDRHHVSRIATEFVTLDGTVVGKQIHRAKFAAALPHGLRMPDLVLGWDISGRPYSGWWHDVRKPNFGDLQARPDLSTLISDPNDDALGRCFIDLLDDAGEEIRIAPRNLLRHAERELADAGFQARVAAELEFMVFRDSFAAAAGRGYRDLSPLSLVPHNLGYCGRNALQVREFMNGLLHALEWQGIEWESWHGEAAPGQLELNLPPAPPLAMADRIIRIRELVHETAQRLGLSATFMAKPAAGHANGMHVHHSLYRDGGNCFASADGSLKPMAQRWLGGLLATLPGQVSLLAPTHNAFRRPVDFNVTPRAATWDRDNRTSALRYIPSPGGGARFECRVGSSDMNPYLGLAALLAGGLAGLRHDLPPPPPYPRAAWTLSGDLQPLPDCLPAAADALLADPYLVETLGQDFIDYWAASRRWEWTQFHEGAENPDSGDVTDWELQRYFALL